MRYYQLLLENPNGEKPVIWPKTPTAGKESTWEKIDEIIKFIKEKFPNIKLPFDDPKQLVQQIEVGDEIKYKIKWPPEMIRDLGFDASKNVASSSLPKTLHSLYVGILNWGRHQVTQIGLGKSQTARGSVKAEIKVKAQSIIEELVTIDYIYGKDSKGNELKKSFGPGHPSEILDELKLFASNKGNTDLVARIDKTNEKLALVKNRFKIWEPKVKEGWRQTFRKLVVDTLGQRVVLRSAGMYTAMAISIWAIWEITWKKSAEIDRFYQSINFEISQDAARLRDAAQSELWTTYFPGALVSAFVLNGLGAFYCYHFAKVRALKTLQKTGKIKLTGKGGRNNWSRAAQLIKELVTKLGYGVLVGTGTATTFAAIDLIYPIDLVDNFLNEMKEIQQNTNKFMKEQGLDVPESVNSWLPELSSQMKQSLETEFDKIAANEEQYYKDYPALKDQIDVLTPQMSEQEFSEFLNSKEIKTALSQLSDDEVNELLNSLEKI